MALTKAQKAEREALKKKKERIREKEYKHITWLASQPEGLKPYIIKLIEADMKRQRRRKKVVNAKEVEIDAEGNIESESV